MAERFEYQKIGNEGAILDRETGDLHLLNEAALDILTLAQNGLDSGAIIESLRRQHQDVDEDVLSRDVSATLAELKKLGIFKDKVL